MASYNYPTFPDSHAKLEYHLRKIKEIVHSYIGSDRRDRGIHFHAVAVCLHQYECDLKAKDALDDDRKGAIDLLNEALTELKGYFFKPLDEGFGSIRINDESDAVIFASYLETETLKLKSLARPQDDETE